MAGLLKQLQKPKARFSTSIADVLITSPTELPNIEQARPGEDFSKQDGELMSAESLLQDVMGSSMRAAEAADSALIVRPGNGNPDGKGASDSRLIRRRKKSADGEGDSRSQELPQWMRERKKTTPQIEALVPAARRMLNEVLPADGDEADLPGAVHKAVELAAQSLCDEMRISKRDQEFSEKELLSLLTGKGPLQPLYDDSGVTDIFIDNHKSIKVIRRGQAIETPFCFRSAEDYKLFVTSMLQSVDRMLNLSTPIVDCVLDDKWRSRVNAIDSSVIDGEEPKVVIRVPRLQQISFYDVLQSKTLPASLAAWLAEIVVSGQTNIMVLGPTGSGKTVMTTALLSAVGSDERVITIEDVPEIFIPTSHLEKLVSRPANAQGEGEVKMPELLKAALRRAPHRIVVGEIRDEEGRLFLRALETGHAGSIATIHADAAADALWRLLDVVAAYERAPQESIMRRIGRSVHLMISMRKIEGRPCLYEICEVLPPAQGEFIVFPLVRYQGILNGKRQWKLLTATSYWMNEMKNRGVPLRSGPNLLPPDIGADENDL